MRFLPNRLQSAAGTPSRLLLEVVMRKAMVFVVVLFAVAAWGQGNLQDCRKVAASVDGTGRAKLQANMRRQMSGSLLQLSTEVGQCINAHSTELSAREIEQLDWLVYRLDSEVLSRMWDFLGRHHLADKFNDEDERGAR